MAGGVLGLVLMAARGRWRQGMRNLHGLLMALALRMAGAPAAPPVLPEGASVGGMPYAVAVAAGTVWCLWPVSCLS
jgi:hypothetical protein